MGRNKEHKRKARKTFSIIVDGQTEVWYLQMLKKNEVLPRIDIKPELPKKKKFQDQYKSVIENSNYYDKVIWIIDFDTIVKETREAKKGSKTPLEYFKKYKREIEGYKNIELLVNTPCLEFWILLHFERIGKYFASCSEVEKLLRKSYLKDYEKTEGYFKKRNGDIYQLLKKHQITARKNAEKLGNFEFNNPYKGLAEIYKILDIFEIK